MQEILESLKIKADVVDTKRIGSVTKYFLRLHPSGKINKIERCAAEIALAARAYSKPIIKVITKEGLVILEMLTSLPDNVLFSELLNDLQHYNYDLPIVLGRTQDENNLIADLSIMPHLLIAGTTGSGKSIMLHSIISSLIISKTNVKLALVDPKRVEFSYYKPIKQLLYPVVSDPIDALDILTDLSEEMENRFKLLSKANVTNIKSFNSINKNPMSHIVLVIDEFSDIMQNSKKDFQKLICTLAQKSRACGIHVILSTQRPSANVVTGLIKANFPARISCQVTSDVDSRIILGCNGAERLLGKGDALIKSCRHNLIRFKGAYISANEVTDICEQNKRNLLSRIINYNRLRAV